MASTSFKIIMVTNNSTNEWMELPEECEIGSGDTIGEAVNEARQYLARKITREAEERIRALSGEAQA